MQFKRGGREAKVKFSYPMSSARSPATVGMMGEWTPSEVGESKFTGDRGRLNFR